MTDKEAIKILKEAIDVINHQETKITILKDYSKDLIAEISNLKSSAAINNVMESQKIKRETKVEAYKEFAEKLKEKALPKCDWDNCVDVEDIDNLLKEMVGETE